MIELFRDLVLSFILDFISNMSIKYSCFLIGILDVNFREKSVGLSRHQSWLMTDLLKYIWFFVWYVDGGILDCSPLRLGNAVGNVCVFFCT